MLKRKLLFLVDVFCMVTTCMVFAVAVFTTIVNPLDRMEAAILWQIPAVAALISLLTLIYPWGRPMGKWECLVRKVIHYVLVNGIVLAAGIFFDWYDPGQFGSVTAMLASIAVIFLVVSGISWRKSAMDARRMNEKLQDLQNRDRDLSHR